MGDTCYPNFVPFAMDEFDPHLYLYYFNGLSPSLRIETNLRTISANPVQGNDFLHNNFGSNDERWNTEFKCWFACQDQWKPIPAHKLYPNWKFHLFLKHILYVFYFSWLIDFSLSIDEQLIGFKGRYVDKTRTPYNNKGGGFQAGEDILALFSWGMK